MQKPMIPRFSELQLVLEPQRGEVVRAFVREAALAEGAPVTVAGLIAGDTAQVWQALCTPGSGRERVRIEALAARGEIRVRILLHGYSRFANIAASLAGLTRRDGGISWHEHGIDGWEVGLHRSLTAGLEPPVPATPVPPAGPLAAPAIAAALTTIYELHVELARADWIAVDFYDGCLMYDFASHELRVIDLDMYSRGPFTNTMGRMFGSTRFMAPEEFELGARIDERTTVFNLGRAAFVFLGERGHDRPSVAKLVHPQVAAGHLHCVGLLSHHTHLHV